MDKYSKRDLSDELVAVESEYATMVQKKNRCTLCSEEVTLNRYTYAPPVTNHPIIDEAYFHHTLGYICTNCFKHVKWDAVDLSALRHDWGWEPEVDETYE